MIIIPKKNTPTQAFTIAELPTTVDHDEVTSSPADTRPDSGMSVEDIILEIMNSVDDDDFDDSLDESTDEMTLDDSLDASIADFTPQKELCTHTHTFQPQYQSRRICRTENSHSKTVSSVQ